MTAPIPRALRDPSRKDTILALGRRSYLRLSRLSAADLALQPPILSAVQPARLF